MVIPESESASLVVRLGALRENFRICRQFSGAAEVAGVVKADGYGLGMMAVARALLDERCDTFFVARLSEGMALRPLAPAARIFVLDGVTEHTVAAFIRHRLTPILNSLEQIETWAGAAREQRAVFDAVIHIDTGMNRLGLPQGECATLAAEAGRRLAALNVVLWMSHLACADDVKSPMNATQRDRFRAALASLPPAPASLSSSGGILLGRDYLFDMVRPGVALYGGNPHPGIPNPFKTVAELYGRVLQLRRVDKGGTVGYGATFRAGHPVTLATVALGYADGLMRAIGNRGAGAIAGVRVPIVGRVSMDLMTLDVTGIPSDACRAGAAVEFLGQNITLESLAEAAGSASYEVLTSLRGRVPRRYVEAA